MESLALSGVECVDDILGYDKLVAAEKTLGEKFNIRAFHDSPCSSSARYRCPLSPRGSIASSPQAVKVLTRIWSE